MLPGLTVRVTGMVWTAIGARQGVRLIGAVAIIVELPFCGARIGSYCRSAVAAAELGVGAGAPSAGAEESAETMRTAARLDLWMEGARIVVLRDYVSGLTRPLLRALYRIDYQQIIIV